VLDNVFFSGLNGRTALIVHGSLLGFQGFASAGQGISQAAAGFIHLLARRRCRTFEQALGICNQCRKLGSNRILNITQVFTVSLLLSAGIGLVFLRGGRTLSIVISILLAKIVKD